MNVLLPQKIEQEAVDLLEKAGHTVVLAEECTPETVKPLMADADAVILRTGIAMSRELIEAAKDLKVISRTGGGFDNVDVQAATDNGVIVTSNLGVNTVSVCEHVLAMMLSLAKKLNVLDAEVRKGNYSVRYRNLSRDLYGKTMGLLGFGRIGHEVASACKVVFNMGIIACDPYVPEDKQAELSDLVTFVDKKTLCRQADVISIHVPLTDETRHAVSAAELQLMKRETIIINTSRGGVIDEKALVESLIKSEIGGAGLDVQDIEPPEEGSPLLTLGNVILTPHSAALTSECVVRMATDAADRTLEVLAGKVPLNVANPAVLKQEKWQNLS